MPRSERDKFYHARQDDPPGDDPEDFFDYAEEQTNLEANDAHLGGVDGHQAPTTRVARPAGQPRQHKRIDLNAIGSLVQTLESADRTRPLVVISVDRHKRTPLVQPWRAARQLGELADVAALEDSNTAWQLSQRIGRTLSCYWGAVRLYWPGFDHRNSKPSEHPVWLSRRIQSLGADSIIDAIAKHIAERQEVATPEDFGPQLPHAEGTTADAVIAAQREVEAASQDRDAALARAERAEGEETALRQRVRRLQVLIGRPTRASSSAPQTAAPYSLYLELARSLHEYPTTFEEALTALSDGANAALAEAIELRDDRDAAQVEKERVWQSAAAELAALQRQIGAANERRAAAERDLAEANGRIEAFETTQGKGNEVQDTPPTHQGQEMQQLEEHAQNLEEMLEDKEQEIEDLNGHVKALQTQLGAMGQSAVSESPVEEPRIESVADAIEHGRTLPNLRFLKSAIGCDGADLFEKPSAVHEGFVLLQESAELRRNGGTGGRLEDWFRDHGVDYVANESQTTRAKRYFVDDAKGTQILCEEHLRFGKGYDPRHCLRVYMKWDDGTHEWIIAYVGKHLRNAKTS